MEVIRDIGEVKHNNDITILQPARWAQIMETRLAEADSRELEPGL